MFLIFQGEVDVFATDEDKLTCKLHQNQVFGERALEKDDRRTATVIAN